MKRCIISYLVIRRQISSKPLQRASGAVRVGGVGSWPSALAYLSPYAYVEVLSDLQSIVICIGLLASSHFMIYSRP